MWERFFRKFVNVRKIYRRVTIDRKDCPRAEGPRNYLLVESPKKKNLVYKAAFKHWIFGIFSLFFEFWRQSLIILYLEKIIYVYRYVFHSKKFLAGFCLRFRIQFDSEF